MKPSLTVSDLARADGRLWQVNDDSGMTTMPG